MKGKMQKHRVTAKKLPVSEGTTTDMEREKIGRHQI